MGAAVGERTYTRIRSDIVMGRLSPGRKLPLDRMRLTYGTSVSTRRELFSRLASEGLVVAEGAERREIMGRSLVRRSRQPTSVILTPSSGHRQAARCSHFQVGQWYSRCPGCFHGATSRGGRLR